MNRRLLIPILLLVAACILVLFFTRVSAPMVPKGATPTASIPAVEAEPPAVSTAAPRPIALVPDAVPDKSGVPRTPEQELQQVSFSIENFRKSLGSNPVGSNAEIAASLLGDNDKKLQIGLPDGVKQNADGELVDRWTTPYFFHAQSATEMEIRSAGPDRKLWTDDDLQIK
jgi:hypothetical protein